MSADIKENFSRSYDEKVDTPVSSISISENIETPVVDSEKMGATVIPVAGPAPAKRRKLLRSSFGVFYTMLHILGLLTSMGIGGLVIYYYSENEGVEHYAVSWARTLMGLPEMGDLPQADELQIYVYAALSCFILGGLFQLSVVWRAYFSPSFLARNPSLSSFWPMAVSLVLRISSEAIYHFSETQRQLSISILWISVSLAYCVLIVDGYWYNDDDPPKITQGKFGIILKPWYVEALELPQ